MKLWWSVAVVVVVSGPSACLACGGIFLDTEGTIASPGYPWEYPHNVDCVYNILVCALEGWEGYTLSTIAVCLRHHSLVY